MLLSCIEVETTHKLNKCENYRITAIFSGLALRSRYVSEMEEMVITAFCTTLTHHLWNDHDLKRSSLPSDALCSLFEYKALVVRIPQGYNQSKWSEQRSFERSIESDLRQPIGTSIVKITEILALSHRLLLIRVLSPRWRAPKFLGVELVRIE